MNPVDHDIRRVEQWWHKIPTPKRTVFWALLAGTVESVWAESSTTAVALQDFITPVRAVVSGIALNRVAKAELTQDPPTFGDGFVYVTGLIGGGIFLAGSLHISALCTHKAADIAEQATGNRIIRPFIAAAAPIVFDICAIAAKAILKRF